MSDTTKTNMGRTLFSGEILVVFAGICWGMIGLFTRKMSESGLDAIQVTFLRNLFAAIALFGIIFIRNRKYLRFSLKDIWMFVGTGICSIAFFNICYFKAIQMTSLSVAAVLLYTAPVMVVIFGCIFLGEKFSLKKVVALGLAFFGCICTTGILGTRPSISGLGMLIGLGSGLGYALYSIFGSVALKKYDTVTITLYTFFMATLGLLPFLFYTTGLKYMEVGKASIMAFIEPLVASVCGIVIFKETLTIYNVLGIMLIFASLVVLNMRKKENARL